MTDNDEHQLPLTDDHPEGSGAVSAAEKTKKSPRRKVAARPRAKAGAASAEVSAPVEERVGDDGSSNMENVVEAPKPRRRTAASKAKAATVESAPAPQQTELLPPVTGAKGDPQSHIETRVIPPEVVEALEKKTVENFGSDGNTAPPARPHHDHQREDEGGASVEARREPEAPAKPFREEGNVDSSGGASGDYRPGDRFESRRDDRGGNDIRRDDRPENRGSGASEVRRDDRPDHRGGNEPRRDDRGGNRDNRGGGGRDFQGRGGGQFQDRPNRHGQQQGGRPQHQQGPRDGGGQREQFRDRDRDQQGPRGGADQGFRDGAPRDQGFRDQAPGAGNGDPLVSRPTEIQFGEGIIEVSGKGFGFLREAKRNFVQTPADIFVTPEVCRKYNLRDGQWIKGEIRRSSRGPQLFRLTELNGEDPEKFRDLPNFDELTTINPNKRIKLETVPERYTTRVMDLMTPIGKGQRGLIVAPPRTGKTTLLQHIAESVVKNHPEMKLIILLVDERPEEVTELRRTVPQAEMMASSNDSDLKSHTRIAQLAMERAKRLVEANFDVFILLDSITRVGRAFNNATGGGGRTMSGGIDARAMEIPRKIFAAARNTEEAGSLTIMATALIDTGSKMDEVIFQEFKGTGNMELVLDRKISDQRIYPAVDIFLSGTRREELLLQPWELDKINVIRRGLAGHKPLEAIERLLSFLKKFPTNAQMLASLPG